MARPAPCATATTIFVDRIGLARTRRIESNLGLSALGIPFWQQDYWQLPDGELEHHEIEMAERLAETAESHGLEALVTLGTKYEHQQREDPLHHPDHQATHSAALLSQRLLLQRGLLVDVIALNHARRGTHKLPSSPNHYQRTFTALGQHQTQMPIAMGMDGELEVTDPTAWQAFTRHHGELLAGRQTYDLHSGADLLLAMGGLGVQRLVQRR